MKNIRKWLDRYQEVLRPLLNNYGYGCTYVEDITCACMICLCKAEQYSINEGILFNKDDFNVVSTKIVDCVKDVLKNKLKNGNRIQFIILHGGSVTVGFGVWVIKEKSEYYDEILNKVVNSGKPYLVPMLMR